MTLRLWRHFVRMRLLPCSVPGGQGSESREKVELTWPVCRSAWHKKSVLALVSVAFSVFRRAMWLSSRVMPRSGRGARRAMRPAPSPAPCPRTPRSPTPWTAVRHVCATEMSDCASVLRLGRSWGAASRGACARGAHFWLQIYPHTWDADLHAGGPRDLDTCSQAHGQVNSFSPPVFVTRARAV